jgi:hypothetical protein
MAKPSTLECGRPHDSAVWTAAVFLNAHELADIAQTAQYA